MGLLDNIKIGVGCGVYKWHVYQIENYHGENDPPCAVFYHEEEAKLSFDYLCDKYKTIRFVVTNIRTGESHAG